MGRFNFLQSSFLLGEASPKMLGRSDLKEYFQMVQEAFNVLILRQGGATRRPGTQYVLKGLYSARDNATYALGTDIRLIPFTFSKTEQYMMVLFTSGHAANNTNTDNGSFFANPYGVALYNIQTGDTILDTYTSSPVSPSILTPAISIAGLNAFSGFTSLAEIQNVHFAQSGDVISLCTGSQMPFFMIRQGTNQFALVDIFGVRSYFAAQRSPTNDNKTLASSNGYESVPYVYAPGFTGQTITLAATTGTNVSVTWTGNGGVSPVADGSLVRVDGGSTTGIGMLKTNGTKMWILKTWPDTSAHTYRVSAWNDTYGYPKTNVFYQQRLIYASNGKFPDTIWGSQQGDLSLLMAERTVDDANFTVATSNDRPFAFAIAQNEIDEIRWLSGGSDLFVGTSGGEWIANGSDPALSLGPLNIGFNLQTCYGSERVQAVRSDGAVHFVQRGGQNIREVIFDFREQHRLAYDMNYYAEHIVKKGLSQRASYLPAKIIQMAYQALDMNITWCLDNNGCLMGLTRDRLSLAGEVKAWHWHALGGTANTSEIPFIQSIACSPSKNGDFDELWMAVQRKIGGSTVTYIEKMGKPYRLNSMFNSSTDIQDKIVLSDCAVMTRLGSPGQTFTGFDHLNGQVCDVFCDGNYLGQATPSSGSISIASLTGNSYTECIAGLPYKARIRPMPVTQGSVMGSADSTPKRIDRAIFRFERTVDASYGKNDDASLMSIPFRDSTVPNGTPTPMFTGVKPEIYQGPMENDADILIESSKALPFTLTSLTLRGVTYEG